MKTGGKVEVGRRRYLARQCLLFFGRRRFSDGNKIKVEDVEFKEDGSVGEWMKKTKTDVVGREECGQDYGRGV